MFGEMVRWEMVQRVKAPGPKPEGLSSIPQSQSMRRESLLSLIFTHVCTYTPAFPFPRVCLYFPCLPLPFLLQFGSYYAALAGLELTMYF